MTHIQQRRDTAAAWAAENPVLFEGEAGHETNTGRWKLGDGSTAWNDLPYKQGVDSVAGKTGAVALVVGDVAGAAPLATPAFTGEPTAPTPNVADDSTRLATTEFVKDSIAPLAPLDSPALTGNPTAPTPVVSDDDTSIATTGFVKDVIEQSPVLGGNPTAPTPAAGDNDTSVATTAFVRNALGIPSSTAWTSYTPVWEIVGTSTVLGSPGSGGGIKGFYHRIGDTVHYRIQLRLGNGFTATTGYWRFSVPFTHVSVAQDGPLMPPAGNGVLYDASSSARGCVPVFLLMTRIAAYSGSGGGALIGNPAEPFAWEWGDGLIFSGSYQAEPL